MPDQGEFRLDSVGNGEPLRVFEGEQPGQGRGPRGTFGLKLKVRSNPNPWDPLQRPGRE